MSEWISVEDRLPKHLDKVLAYWPVTNKGNLRQDYSRMDVGWWNGGAFVIMDVGYASYEPTHWMPLPEFPSEGERL